MPKFTDDLIEYARSLKDLDINLEDRKSIKGISIDAKETQDIDDTIWVVKKDDIYICDISIADTSAYIQPNDPIFEVASQNVATKYLKKYAVQMIPAELSKKHLSLKPDKYRPSINFHIELDAQLNVIYFNISERKICNSAKLSYEEVAALLSDANNDSLIRDILLNAYELALKLSTKRRLMGALAYFDEEKGLYTDEEGNIKTFASKQVAIAYMIVQEMMVLVNSETARYFAERDIPFVFRNHTVKGNIPDRDEVHNQLVHALQNKAMFKSFAARMNIWQNKAQYGTELSGHYALNLPAYAHVTSPLRRFADMLNHVIIKSHIYGKEIPLNLEEIKEHCGNINAHMLKEQQEKHEHFKSEAYSEIAEKLERMSSKDLPEMEPKEFKQTLKSLRNANKIKPIMRNEVVRRIESFNIASIDLYYLLFESEWMNEEAEIKEKIYKSISDRQGLATELLTLMQVQEKIKGYTEVLGVEGNLFTAYSVIETLENKYLTSDICIKNLSKKSAIDEARGSTLIAFIQGNAKETSKPEINPEEILLPIQPKKKPKSESENNKEFRFHNPVGLIQEIVVKRNDMTLLGYEIEQIEDSVPRFQCILKIIFEGEEFEFSGEGENKKAAKFEAAHRAAEKFEDFNPSKKRSKKEQLKGLIADGMYLNAINFACTIENEEMPVYEIEKIEEDNTFYFVCRGSVNFKNSKFSAEARGSNKKEPKLQSAKSMLEEILESYPEILIEL